MAKPVFPVIEEGVTYNPGDLKESLGHLWYEGVEDDINRRMIKSLDDLKRVKGGNIASRALKGAVNIAQGNRTNASGEVTGKLPAAEKRTALQRIIDNIPEREDSLNLFGKPAQYKKISDLTDDQIKTLERAQHIGMKGLVHILNNLANPLQQLPISPLQQQATSISNSLSGPLLLSLLNQPSPSSFAPMYASQLAQQQGPGLGDMLGSLAAPALQAALPYIGSLFNRQG